MNTQTNLDEYLTVCELLSDDHYLISIADMPARIVNFHILDTQGIAYFMPRNIPSEFQDRFSNDTQALMPLTRELLETMTAWLVPRLQIDFEEIRKKPRKSNLPQHVLDLFYRAKKYEIFEKARQKMKRDFEEEEKELG